MGLTVGKSLGTAIETADGWTLFVTGVAIANYLE
jgi:hypothetical protein